METTYQVGQLVDVDSHMGGSFTVRLTAAPNGDTPLWTGRIEMPGNPDWHGYVITFAPGDIRRPAGT